MRVKFGDTIRRVKFVSLCGDMKLLNISTDNGLYSVEFNTYEEKLRVYNQILTDGWSDVSHFQYKNY